MHDQSDCYSTHEQQLHLAYELVQGPPTSVMNGMIIFTMCILLLMWMLGEQAASRIARRLFFISLIGLSIQNYCFLISVCEQVLPIL